jgi:hypothetical protein
MNALMKSQDSGRNHTYDSWWFQEMNRATQF